jgi:hypothetical protein
MDGETVLRPPAQRIGTSASLTSTTTAVVRRARLRRFTSGGDSSGPRSAHNRAPHMARGAELRKLEHRKHDGRADSTLRAELRQEAAHIRSRKQAEVPDSGKLPAVGDRCSVPRWAPRCSIPAPRRIELRVLAARKHRQPLLRQFLCCRSRWLPVQQRLLALRNSASLYSTSLSSPGRGYRRDFIPAGRRNYSGSGADFCNLE